MPEPEHQRVQPLGAISAWARAKRARCSSAAIGATPSVMGVSAAIGRGRRPPRRPRAAGGRRRGPEGGSPEKVPAAGSHRLVWSQYFANFGPGNPFLTKRDPEARPAIVPVRSSACSPPRRPRLAAAQDGAAARAADLRGSPRGGRRRASTAGSTTPPGRPSMDAATSSSASPRRACPPPRQTQFKVLYDDDALYFAFRAFDDPEGLTSLLVAPRPLPRRLGRGQHRQLRRPAHRASPSRSASPAPAATSSSPRTATAGTATGTRSGKARPASTTRAGPPRCGSP